MSDPYCDHSTCIEELRRLNGVIAKLKAALRWYANPAQWQRYVRGEEAPALGERGQRARNALENRDLEDGDGVV